MIWMSQSHSQCDSLKTKQQWCFKFVPVLESVAAIDPQSSLSDPDTDAFAAPLPWCSEIVSYVNQWAATRPKPTIPSICENVIWQEWLDSCIVSHKVGVWEWKKCEKILCVMTGGNLFPVSMQCMIQVSQQGRNGHAEHVWLRWPEVREEAGPAGFCWLEVQWI